MPNFSQQPAQPLRNLLGETLDECAARWLREARGDRHSCRQRAERLAVSPLAHRDGTADFYRALSAHFSEG